MQSMNVKNFIRWVKETHKAFCERKKLRIKEPWILTLDQYYLFTEKAGDTLESFGCEQLKEAL